MSKQEIIDYVMTTPGNTNPMILKQKIDESIPKKLSEFENDLIYTAKEALVLPKTQMVLVDNKHMLEKPIDLVFGGEYLVQINDNSIAGVRCGGTEEEPCIELEDEPDRYHIYRDRLEGTYEVSLALWALPKTKQNNKMFAPTLDLTEYLTVSLEEGDTYYLDVDEEIASQIVFMMAFNDNIRINFNFMVGKNSRLASVLFGTNTFYHYNIIPSALGSCVISQNIHHFNLEYSGDSLVFKVF